MNFEYRLLGYDAERADMHKLTETGAAIVREYATSSIREFSGRKKAKIGEGIMVGAASDGNARCLCQMCEYISVQDLLKALETPVNHERPKLRELSRGYARRFLGKYGAYTGLARHKVSKKASLSAFW